jgi:AraC family transcriptional regulator, regulatory protein of adaptative response / methylated-DNA-[protein]-cysteine methyltransferase
MVKDDAAVLQNQAAGARDYERVERAITFLIENRDAQPSLEDVSEQLGLSAFHVQRLFTRWAGVSPKRFLSYLTIEHAKYRLEQSASVLEAAYDAGLSGSSRLHDLMVSAEAMTPGEYKAMGSDLTIRHGLVPTPYGRALFLVSDRGLCGLEFVDGAPEALLADAKERWPLSQFIEDQSVAQAMSRKVFTESETIPILMKGTPWQLQVWSALLRIPGGSIVSYGQIADSVCSRKASRAVGTAVAANHIGYVVPCHRVLRATGLFKRYRWGAPRRWAILAREAG